MEQLEQLFLRWAGIPPRECLAIGASGSNRRYYRLVGQSTKPVVSVIGCINDDCRENEAFFAFARHLRSHGIRVPEVYAISDDRRVYLQEDLGDLTLYGILLEKKRQGGGFDAQILALYRQALADLAAIQIAGADADFSLAYPRPQFDLKSILWDLNYFKYLYLKLVHVPFDEQLLDDDFDTLAHTLLATDCIFFLYRDFNPRNIMFVESKSQKVKKLKSATDDSLPLYYIDFQGGRRGASQYDVASLLYSAKSDLPEPIRLELLNHYLDVRGLSGAERQEWLRVFWSYVLVRILQTLGAYGYRGLYERKEYFLSSIPLALRNLRFLIDNHPDVLDRLPHLSDIIRRLNETAEARELDERTCLTVTVMSFSYKQGLPVDESGNGGGYIFDCRALPNPGRYAEYKPYTGKDRPVIEFLQREKAVADFLHDVKGLVAQSVEKYCERRFSHLQVAFGCTGGQHRSVYCAEQIAAWLQIHYPDCHVVVRHREQETK